MKEISVENASRLVDIIANGVSTTQFIRELQMNSMEAINRAGTKNGLISWGIDPEWKKKGIEKLNIVDNGDGMDAREMERYLASLAVEGGNKSHGKESNFGVGAKISCLHQNPYGIEYKSWKNGNGHKIVIALIDGKYCIKESRRIKQSEKKPPEIKGNGTSVTLLGKSRNENTARRTTDKSKKETPGFKWLAQILNTKFYQFPDGIKIQASDLSSEGKLKRRTIKGIHKFLSESPLGCGTVELKSCRVHWSIQDDIFYRDKGALIGYDLGSAGHVAIIHEDEVYEKPRNGYAKLQSFGVYSGCRNVHLYIEPFGEVLSDITRSRLLINGEELPWEEYSKEFQKNMPQQLKDYIESKIGVDHSQSIKEKLKDLIQKFKIPKYRKTSPGIVLASVEVANRLGPGIEISSGLRLRTKKKSKSMGKSPGQAQGRGEVVDVYYGLNNGDNEAIEEGHIQDFPQVRWVSTNPPNSKVGLRDEDDMNDRIGRYIYNSNTLLINMDYRVFDGVIEHWKNKLKITSETELVIVKESIFKSYELTLVDAIIHSKQLFRNKSPEWTEKQVEELLANEAVLSLVVSPMYHATNTIKSEIKRDLGRLR
jgi:hypothetical protein